jgi:DNA polymerase-3 subunit alpha
LQKSKSILNDIERVYSGHPDLYENGEQLFKANELIEMIESSRGITDDLSILKSKKEFINKYEKYIKPESPDFRPLIAHMFSVASILENNTRQMGRHAAGIIISPEPIVNYCPLTKISSTNKEISYVTQYDMKTIEAIGLIKIDVLGLETLDLISKTVQIVKERRGIDININEINLGDIRSFAFLNETDTYDGLFQISSKEFKKMLKTMNPDRVSDLCAGAAIK